MYFTKISNTFDQTWRSPTFLDVRWSCPVLKGILKEYRKRDGGNHCPCFYKETSSVPSTSLHIGEMEGKQTQGEREARVAGRTGWLAKVIFTFLLPKRLAVALLFLTNFSSPCSSVSFTYNKR